MMRRLGAAGVLGLAVLVVAGCGSGGSSASSGGGTNTPPPPTAPTVTSTTPASGATSVAVNTTISATFSEAMTASTITASNFTVTPAGGAAVTGTVAYNSSTNVATFTPSANLANGTTYTVSLAAAMTSSAGAALSTYTWSFTTVAATPSGTVAVDFGTAGQVIRGFGGSEAWSGVMPATQISTLYGTGSTDLALSIMRVRIAPATWNSTAKTADTTQWTAELTNAKAAQAMGATVFATPWSAPASMKTDNSVNSGSLNSSSYADYADYLEAYANYANSLNVNLYAISMQNEPDWDPCGTGGPTAASCYESCIWTGAQMDTWVANNSSVLTVPLMMPESYYFAATMSDPTLNDPNAVNKVKIVGGHLYGHAAYYYTNAENLHKDVWMTEHTINLASGETSTQSMADALTEAMDVHNSMTVGQYNAYVYWWMVNSTSLNYYSGLLDTSGNMTWVGAGLAQYARFVRPGYSRYTATVNPLTGVYVSAYGGSGHQAIVVINTASTGAQIAFTIQNQSISSLTPYQTTSAGMVAAQPAVTLSGNQFTYTVPAQSITTFVE
ncbi:MAG: Ig-like domain-containing protein [Acidobacteriota bacterium]